MVEKVFISHKNTDTVTANNVATRIRANGLNVYLDVIDTALVKDGPDLSDYLLKKMGECQQLVAIISRETQSSWWVPWEIGVGSEKGFRMATYAATNVAMPSYLQKWPVLRSSKDIDLYCKISKSSNTTLSILEAAKNTTERLVIRKNTAASFHRDLKVAISRGY